MQEAATQILVRFDAIKANGEPCTVYHHGLISAIGAHNLAHAWVPKQNERCSGLNQYI